MKKILSIILAILMIVTSVPFAFAAETDFKITHQPTVDEYYVETNDPNATYQWYEMTADAYEIDDTCASPVQPGGFYSNSSYDVETGWTPSVAVLGPVTVGTLKYFIINFEDDETLTIQFSSDNINEVYLVSNDGGEDIEITPDGNTATCTVNRGEWLLCVESEEVITLRAWMKGSGVAMDGETSAQLDTTKIKEGNEYFCEVVYSDDTSEQTDKVLAHEHTGAELTCMGYKCTICGGFFGEETGDHSFTKYLVTTVPTETRQGIEKAVCDNGCGAEDKRAVPVEIPKAEIEVVYDELGNRVGFETISVKDRVYFDIYDGEYTLDNKNVADFYKDVLTKKYNKISALDVWSRVAENVFRIGGRTYGYNWEYGSYDEWFDVNKSNENGDINLQEQFAQTEPYSTGKPEYNCVRASGLELYSSMNNVQKMMLDQIVEVCGEKKVSEDFKKTVLDYCTIDGEGLELLKDETEQPVLAHIVTSQYDGAAHGRFFSSFGIAFYDFKLTPVVEENLQYISAADNYDSVKDAFYDYVPGVSYVEGDDDTTSISYIQNPTGSTASVSASISNSVTNSISNSFTESENYSFTESVSTNFEWQPIKDFFKFSVNVGFSTSQAIGTAYSESKSLSESVSTSSSVAVTLPPYTEIGVKQSSSSVEESLSYDCPVYVTYKVAIFGMNAEYYQASGDGYWETADYDQGSICVGFGDNLTLGGLNAVENLYKRLQANSNAFEVSHGNVTGMYEDQGDGTSPVKLSYIDWDSIEDTNDLMTWAEHAVNNIPMSSMGAEIFVTSDSLNTEITQIYPMYDLKRIRFENSGAYTLGIGGKLDLNTVDTIGLNEFDREYYGYLPRMGTWYVCDKDGNDVTYEEGKGIYLEPTPSTQTIVANEIGEYYVRFDIDEHYYTKAVDRKTFITNDDLEFTAILKLSVTDTGNNHTCRPGGWITYIPANCVVDGERYRNCLTCSKRMATEVIPKADHIPVETVVPATCNTDGSKTTTCLTCKAIISNEVIPAKGHVSTYGVTTVTPTCTRDGEKALYCYDCNLLVGSQVIASTGHDKGVWKIDFEATPEHEGQMTKYCSICNVALETKTFTYHTHSYTAWGMNGNGTHTRSCYLCSFTETANCDYDETVTPASCLVDGETTYKCKDCSYKYTEINSYAQGHTWNMWTDNDDGYHSATCTVCGEGERTVHVFVEYIPNNDATKDADGTKTATCVVCAAKDTVIDEGSKLVDPDTDNSDTDSEVPDVEKPLNWFQKIIKAIKDFFAWLFRRK